MTMESRMVIQDIKRVVDQVSRDKGIDRDVLIKALEEALKSAARKKLGAVTEIETEYDEKTGEIEVFQFKEVVEKVTDPSLQISIEDMDVEQAAHHILTQLTNSDACQS